MAPRLDEPFLVKMTILLKVRGDKKLFLYPNIVSLRMHTHGESLRKMTPSRTKVPPNKKK